MSVFTNGAVGNPYKSCVKCDNIGVYCDGPNFLDMSMDELCEWCRARKDYLYSEDQKWTNAYIADLTGFSKGSVDRLLSGNMVDAKRETVAGIAKVLTVGPEGSWGRRPCSWAEKLSKVEYVENPETVEKLEAAEKEIKRLQDIIQSKSEEHKAQMETAQAEKTQRIEFLREQVRTKDKLLDERADFLRIKDRYIRILSVLFVSAMIAFVGLIIADIMSPDLGYLFVN